MRFDPSHHHRRSIRLPGYDYAAAGSYFVTLCAHERAMLFGDVIRGDTVLNECGQIVLEEWHRSVDLRPSIGLDVVVVMPNHLHGIVTFGRFDEELGDGSRNPNGRVGEERAYGCTPLRRFRRRPRSLGSFVSGFKSAATKRINEVRGLPGTPVWQRNYYEHVIRNDDAYARIYNYVVTNPLRWAFDAENPERWAEDEFDHWLRADAAVSSGRGRPSAL